jgi:hypothetical protein
VAGDRGALGWDSTVQGLRARGADRLDHPGGTLLEHLCRVGDRLRRQGTALDTVAAGLCHAAYGTAGFPHALFGLSERDLLVSWIGPGAENLVYLYCASDRRKASPEDGWPWTLHDRFIGARVTTTDHVARALLDITVANEIDILEHAPLSPTDRAELAALVKAYQSLRQWP